jgi:hypothetical protein
MRNTASEIKLNNAAIARDDVAVSSNAATTWPAVAGEKPD